MARALRLLVLCTALLATARAVHLGEPGVGSQYQLFGRPITDTSAISSRSTVVPRHIPGQVLAVEGDAQQTGAKAVSTDAAAKQKCEGDYLYSEIFGKCLPAAGKDGYIGAAEHDKGKGKALPSHSGFVPISSVATDVHMPLPLRAIPIQPLPLRTAALNREPQPAPQPQPAQPPSQGGGGGQPARAMAPVQQLRLACPAGFTFQPQMGACIAPASSMFGPQQAMAMRRGDDGDDDDNDDSDELRRDLMMRARRHRMRHRMFGRRFGGPRILAPVFVFVLPPNALDRNATMRLGQHFGRVHEVHPSLVGGGKGEQRTGSSAPSGPAAAETPIAKPSSPAPAAADKPKGSPTGTGAGTATGEEPPKALRGAFVNPIVTGSSGGKALPLKATASGTGDEPQTQTRAQPLMRSDSAAVPALKQRAEFISPFVAQTQTRDAA